MAPHVTAKLAKQKGEEFVSIMNVRPDNPLEAEERLNTWVRDAQGSMNNLKDKARKDAKAAKAMELWEATQKRYAKDMQLRDAGPLKKIKIKAKYIQQMVQGALKKKDKELKKSGLETRIPGGSL
jgi:hypothetical protein